MKREWELEELIECWTLDPEEVALLANKTGATRLGFLRTPVIGRKNFYGSGSAWAADLAADIWTITATAAQHDIQPLQLMIDYLDSCAAHQGKPPDDLNSFLSRCCI